MTNNELYIYIRDLKKELRKIEVEFVDCSLCSVDEYKELCLTCWKLEDLISNLSYKIPQD